MYLLSSSPDLPPSIQPVFLDIETTGLLPQACDVLEIAAVDLDSDSDPLILCTYGYEIRKHATVTPKAMEINKWYTREHPPSLPRETALRLLQSKLAGKCIVGSNPTFDILFLQYQMWEILRETPSWYYRPIDISTFAMPYVGGYLLSLQKLAAYFSIAVDSEHTALSDAQTTRAIYKRVCELRHAGGA